jgi:SAM-dependent methyltransferase
MSSTYTASDGEAYERLMGRWSPLLADQLIAFAGVGDGDEVLDLGCGTGSLALALAAHTGVRRILGIDAAPAYIAYAAQRSSDRRLSFAVGDGAALGLPDGSVDRAFSLLALNFMATPAQAIAELRRVTRAGGVVAAAVWDFSGGLVYQRIFWDTASSIDPKAGGVRDRLFSTPLATPDGLLQLFASNGLIKLERDSLTIRMDYVDFGDYWQPLLGGQGPVGTYASSLAPVMRARVEDAVRAAYLAGAPDGPRSMTATAWAVRAVVP